VGSQEKCLVHALRKALRGGKAIRRGRGTMKCMKCGAENPDQAEFCEKCGQRIARNWKVASNLIACALVLIGLLLLWQFAYAIYYGWEYDFSYYDGIDWVDRIALLFVGVVVTILGFLSYTNPRNPS